MIKKHLGKSIDFVGTHGIAGLPLNVIKLKTDYSYELFEEQGLKPYLDNVVLPIEEWINEDNKNNKKVRWAIDGNLIKFCRMYGVWIISGCRSWDLQPKGQQGQGLPPWKSKDIGWLADALVIKRLITINGQNVCVVCPTIDFKDLIENLANKVQNNETLKDVTRSEFKKAIKELLDDGFIYGYGTLVIFILVHPWQLVEEVSNTDKKVVDLLKEFIEWINNKELDFILDNMLVHFELNTPSRCIELINEIIINHKKIRETVGDKPTYEPVFDIKIEVTDMEKISTYEDVKIDDSDVEKLWEKCLNLLSLVSSRLQKVTDENVKLLVRDTLLSSLNKLQIVKIMSNNKNVVESFLTAWMNKIELLYDYLYGQAHPILVKQNEQYKTIVMFRCSCGEVSAVFLNKNWWRPFIGIVRGKVILECKNHTDLVVKGEIVPVGLNIITDKVDIAVDDENGNTITEVHSKLNNLKSGITIRLGSDKQASFVRFILEAKVQGQGKMILDIPIPVPKANVSGKLTKKTGTLFLTAPKISVDVRFESGGRATLIVNYNIGTSNVKIESIEIELRDKSDKVVEKIVQNKDVQPVGSVRFCIGKGGKYRIIMVAYCLDTSTKIRFKATTKADVTVVMQRASSPPAKEERRESRTSYVRNTVTAKQKPYGGNQGHIHKSNVTVNEWGRNY
ncbi:hypothetical protein [Methanopyrus sp. SNP6]|uniref:hypothetical protein n=1 Tax=Methanopyrus sp. SNP6 TaxID=1937005 RepID=UPI0011E5B65C|nr:hypothetical protein [Methanopyrus sp. SNP6]